MKLEIQNIKSSFKRDYEGTWLFSYDADYILDIQTDKSRACISLYDSMEERELNLTLIKYSEFYILLFVEDEGYHFYLKLYPMLRTRHIGIEIRWSEVFEKSRLNKTEQYHFSRFISIGDTFPDWVNGIWRGGCSSISFVMEKEDSAILKIAAQHQLTGNIDIAENGHMGHTGLILTLCHHEWIDKTLVCELQFDYLNKNILYVEKMMLPAQPIHPHCGGGGKPCQAL